MSEKTRFFILLAVLALSIVFFLFVRSYVGQSFIQSLGPH